MALLEASMLSTEQEKTCPSQTTTPDEYSHKISLSYQLIAHVPTHTPQHTQHNVIG